MSDVPGTGSRRQNETPEQRAFRIKTAVNLRVKRFREKERLRKESHNGITSSHLVRVSIRFSYQPLQTAGTDAGTDQPEIETDGAIPLEKRPRGKAWTADEENSLRKGVETYGIGKWQKILNDPELGLTLHSRSNVDLKDKVRSN
jgi:hypothetical protein